MMVCVRASDRPELICTEEDGEGAQFTYFVQDLAGLRAFNEVRQLFVSGYVC